MADKQEASVPTSIAMLIGEINGTIKSEFTSVKSEFTSLKNDIQSLRIDLSTVREDHEKRLNVLEQDGKARTLQVKQFEQVVDDVEELKTWRATREGNWAGASWAASLGKVAFGAGLTVAAYLGFSLVHTDKPAKADHPMAQVSSHTSKPL